MPGQRRFTQSRFLTSRPNRTWAGTLSTAGVTVASTTKVLIGTFTLNNAGIDETALRTVGKLAVSSDQTAASEVITGALGMIVVTDQAATIGITAIPGPVTDASDDGWFLYVPISQRILVATAVGLGESVGYAFDSKAKRVVHDGTRIAIVIENATTSAFIANLAIRLLSQVRGTR